MLKCKNSIRIIFKNSVLQTPQKRLRMSNTFVTAFVNISSLIFTDADAEIFT